MFKTSHKWNLEVCNLLKLAFSRSMRSESRPGGCVSAAPLLPSSVPGVDVPCLFNHLAVSSLGLLQLKQLWTAVYRFLCKHKFSFLYNKHPVMQPLGPMVTVCFTKKKKTNSSTVACIILPSYWQCMNKPVSPQPHQYLMLSFKQLF